MRGKEDTPGAVARCSGITPAYAGKSRRKTTDRFCSRDHPRMCGEKDKAKEMGATTKGSPPRVRGKAAPFLHTGQRARITPAYAGKSWAGMTSTALLSDHPRACGEKPIRFKRALVGPGSPPRMRGKALRCPVYLWRAGITPACAGKSIILWLSDFDN